MKTRRGALRRCALTKETLSAVFFALMREALSVVSSALMKGMLSAVVRVVSYF